MLRKDTDPDGGGAPDANTVRSDVVDGTALARCIAISAEQFATEYWGRAPLLTPARSSRDFSDLFSVDAVDELVSRRGLRTPFLRMAREGVVLGEGTFTAPGGTGATISDQASDEKILARLHQGATLVLQALHRNWPPLLQFAGALSAELGHPVQINSYVTPAQNQGFSPHYDTHDVFVLQIAGTKRWIIHEPVLEHPLADQPWDRRKAAVSEKAAQTPLLDRVLEPGDALYLPRGFLHSAAAQGELSIHLTVGIHPITGYRVAETLIQALKNDPEVRRSLPVGVDLSDPQVLANSLRRIADRVVEAARNPDDLLDAVAAGLGAELRRSTRPAPISPIRQLAAADALGPEDPVRLRPALRLTINDTADSISVTALDKTVSFPRLMSAAVRRLLSGTDVVAGSLQGLDDGERLVLVRRLLREGFLVPTAPIAPDAH